MMEEFIFDGSADINSKCFNEKLIRFACKNTKPSTVTRYTKQQKIEQVAKHLTSKGMGRSTTDGIKSDLLMSKEVVMNFQYNQKEGEHLFNQWKTNIDIEEARMMTELQNLRRHKENGYNKWTCIKNNTNEMVELCECAVFLSGYLEEEESSDDMIQV